MHRSMKTYSKNVPTAVVSKARQRAMLASFQSTIYEAFADVNELIPNL